MSMKEKLALMAEIERRNLDRINNYLRHTKAKKASEGRKASGAA